MTVRDSLIDDIRAAFPPRRPADLGPLVNSDLGDEPQGVAAAFAPARDWPGLSAEWLDRVPLGLGTALSFLSDPAICFYIPAYLVADLHGGLQRADPVFHLVHGFDGTSARQPLNVADDRGCRTWGDYARRRWAGLAPAQVRAVVHYLEDRAVWRPEVAPGIVEALANYWYARA